MWSTTLIKVSILVAITLLIVAFLTPGWQTLSVQDPKVYTNIGLWKTCTKEENKQEYCYFTKADHHQVALNCCRVLGILAILFTTVSCVGKHKKLSLLFLGLAALCGSIVMVLYSTQLENFFSQDFDNGMSSQL